MADENGGIFMPKKYNTIIIGGGTAGLTAAIYTARQNKSVAVFESGIFGGQIVDSPRIENYPGFCEISGDEFSDRLLKQALKLGAELIKKRAAAIKLEGKDKYVISADGEKTQCDKIIIAVGFILKTNVSFWAEAFHTARFATVHFSKVKRLPRSAAAARLCKAQGCWQSFAKRYM